MIRNTQDTSARSTPAIVGNLILQPFEKIEFLVGIYEDALPQPKVNVRCNPKNAGFLTATLARLEGKGEYSLVYHLKNTSPYAFRLTVWADWPD